MNLSFDLVSIVVEDKEVWTETSSEHGTDLLNSLDVSRAGDCREERTSCKLPSPTNKTVRLSSFASLAARAAPRVAPTDHPIDPHRI
jgi:hypothetical protein